MSFLLFLTLFISMSYSCSEFSDAFRGVMHTIDMYAGYRGGLANMFRRLNCEHMHLIHSLAGPIQADNIIGLHDHFQQATKKRGMTVHNIDWQEPAYVRSPVFSAFVWPTRAVQMLYDSDSDGAVYDETGDWDFEAGFTVAKGVIKVLAAAAEAFGGGSVPFVVKSALEVAAAVVEGLLDMIKEQDDQHHQRTLQRLVSDARDLHAATRCTPAWGWASNKFLVGQGCNGQNDNCDDTLQIDECDEDKIVPTFQLRPTSLPQWFTAGSDVLSAVTQMVTISDDCNPFTSSQNLTSNCDASNVNVTASDECGNTATVIIPVNLDDTRPTISCSVVTNYLVNVDNGLYNVGFSYVARDNCGDNQLTVRLALFADESVENSVTPQGYIQRTVEGQYKGILLRASNGYNSNGRVYTIIATATDRAGLSASCNSTVSVKFNNVNPYSAFNDGPNFLVTNCNNVDV